MYTKLSVYIDFTQNLHEIWTIFIMLFFFFFYLTGPLFVAVVLKKRSVNILQNISFLCSMEEWKSYRFEM